MKRLIAGSLQKDDVNSLVTDCWEKAVLETWSHVEFMYILREDKTEIKWKN